MSFNFYLLISFVLFVFGYGTTYLTKYQKTGAVSGFLGGLVLYYGLFDLQKDIMEFVTFVVKIFQNAGVL